MSLYITGVIILERIVELIRPPINTIAKGENDNSTTFTVIYGFETSLITSAATYYLLVTRTFNITFNQIIDIL
ncbi:hypothetical protein AR685_16670 [Chryseobacterium sp. JAH]|nr:hypothetical protein AR685_16670 [Chryseobacterium sp. JAH]